MLDRPPTLLTQTLVWAALLFSHPSLAQTDQWHRIELMVFSHTGGGAAEQWEAAPVLEYPAASRFLIDPRQATVNPQQAGPLAPVATTPGEGTLDIAQSPRGALPPTPFTTLPAEQREFRDSAASMQRGGRYQVLFHEAWVQPMTNQAAALPIVLDRSGDGGDWPALQGTIRLYLLNYLYLETNLWLNTQGEYLHSAWRMPPPPLGPASMIMAEPETIEPAPLARQPNTVPRSGSSLAKHQETVPGAEALAPTYPFRHAVLIKQTRRMRSGEVHYIDHPLLGIVVKTTPLSAE